MTQREGSFKKSIHLVRRLSLLILLCYSPTIPDMMSVYGFSTCQITSRMKIRSLVDSNSDVTNVRVHRTSTLVMSSSIKSYFTSSSSAGTVLGHGSDGPFQPVSPNLTNNRQPSTKNSETIRKPNVPQNEISKLEPNVAIFDPNARSSSPDQFVRNNNLTNVTFSSVNGNNSSNNKNDRNDTNSNNIDNDKDLLSYLGTQELIDRIPPQTRDLLRRITYNYIYGPSNTMTLSLQEIATIIESEHRSRDVPVQIVDGTSGTASMAVLFTADVTKTGEAFDELCAEILSIGALYQLPKEIVLELLSSMPLNGRSVDGSSAATLDYNSNTFTMLASSMNKCRNAFANTGWDGVIFPMGLAIRPKTKFRSIWSLPLLRNSNGSNGEQPKLDNTERIPAIKMLPLSWFHRNKTLREIAATAVKSAAHVKPPPRQLIDRRLYLSTLDQQIRQLSLSTSTKPAQPPETVAISNVPAPSSSEWMISDTASSSLAPPNVGFVRETSPTVSATGQLFFPNSDRKWWQNVLSFSSKRRSFGNGIRTVRRMLAQQYNALKRQGRAGLISYCLFNFLYYTIGIVWQWPRMPIIPTTSADGGDVISNLLSSSSTILSSSFLQDPQWTIPTLLLRKFGKIFAYLYAFSQLLKIPKLCTAVGLAPLSSKALDFIQQRCNVKETSATIILISAMVLFWCMIIAFPILSEYASLKHILYLEEQLVQVYGLQPA